MEIKRVGVPEMSVEARFPKELGIRPGLYLLFKRIFAEPGRVDGAASEIIIRPGNNREGT